MCHSIPYSVCHTPDSMCNSDGAKVLVSKTILLGYRCLDSSQFPLEKCEFYCVWPTPPPPLAVGPAVGRNGSQCSCLWKVRNVTSPELHAEATIAKRAELFWLGGRTLVRN
ncbi:hypothetical protein BsWGS_23193 [Bradybaena similaris]